MIRINILGTEHTLRKELENEDENNYSLVFPFKYNDFICSVIEIKEFMNDNEINKLMTQLRDFRLHEAGMGPDNIVNSHRKSKICFLSKSPEFKYLYMKLFNFIIKINDDTFKFNLTELSEAIQFTEYDESYQGHYDWHLDIGNSFGSRRKLSIVIQLSDPDEYEGGELQICEKGYPRICCKTKGTIIAFPSFLNHRVTPVTKGTRRSLVLWSTGPPFV
jgi:PKHD-type hydroxylase